MNGLEIAKEYYEQYGKPMLEAEFSDILPLLAVGFVGSGSERFGFDDEISRDHDFEPGFCIFLPDEQYIDSKTEFKLERAYSRLPKEFKGLKRQGVSPVGGNRNGIIRTADFYRNAIGCPDGNLTLPQWLELPDYALAEAVNGEVFYDGFGEFTDIRNKLIHMPEDIRLKRLAGNLLIMAQAGQYNYQRCLDHNEPEAAQFACNEFVDAAMKTVFLLHNRYQPYYKWSFRALRQIEGRELLAERLSFILLGDHSDKAIAEEKFYMIEDVASEIIAELHKQEITDAICGDLEKHAYSVNDRIKDGDIRNLHILTAIQ
ncbi:MAG: DUF4037 domain-containing protein [Erysipelotrichaceae bacterium]|nr:DUF4037 domain-containing protein [Erysipelotrichaceae bacterium]